MTTSDNSDIPRIWANELDLLERRGHDHSHISVVHWPNGSKAATTCDKLVPSLVHAAADAFLARREVS